MVEKVEILAGRLGKRSVERVRYVINNLLHLVIVKYGDISLVLCISTRLRLVTILSLLVKYLVIGERAKRARHSQVCSIENRIYIYILGMCSFQHKWASERQLYLFVLLHHGEIVWCKIVLPFLFSFSVSLSSSLFNRESRIYIYIYIVCANFVLCSQE